LAGRVESGGGEGRFQGPGHGFSRKKQQFHKACGLGIVPVGDQGGQFARVQRAVGGADEMRHGLVLGQAGGELAGDGSGQGLFGGGVHASLVCRGGPPVHRSPDRRLFRLTIFGGLD